MSDDSKGFGSEDRMKETRYRGSAEGADGRDSGFMNKASDEARRWYQEQNARAGEPGVATVGKEDSHYAAKAQPPAARPGRVQDVSGSATDAEDPNSRALNEKPGQGSDGPHILDRSFSGTYKD